MFRKSLYTSISLVVILVFLLAACAPREVVKTVIVTEMVEGEIVEKVVTATPEAVVPPEEEVIHLRVAMVDEYRERPIRDELLPKFTEMTGIEVTIDLFNVEQLYQKALAASYAHSGEYDVIQIHHPAMALFDSRGYMADISDLVERDREEMDLDDIHPALQVSHMQYDGKWYGVPMHLGSHALYYRTDIFEEEGYEVPTTYEELMDIARDFNAKYAPDRYGLVMMLRKDTNGIATYINILASKGIYLYDENNRPMMDTPEALEAMKLLKEMYLLTDTSSLYGYSEAFAAFAQDKAAMMINWDVTSPYLDDPDNSIVMDKYDLAPLPDGGFILGGWSVQISADSPNREAAWEFLKWIVSKEIDKDLIGYYCSSRLSTMTDPELEGNIPGCRVYAESIDQGTMVNYPRTLPGYEIMDELAVAVSSVMIDLKTPEEALAELQVTFEKLMELYGLWTP